MSAPISTRTRHRATTTPILSLQTTLTRPSHISKSRTPISRTYLAPSYLSTPSTASSRSSTSLLSALSFSHPSSTATASLTPLSAATPCSPAASKAMLAAASSLDAPASALEARRALRKKERVVLWPSQLYQKSEGRRSEESLSARSEGSGVGSVGGGELDGYLAVLQGAMSRASSEAVSSRRGTPVGA